MKEFLDYSMAEGFWMIFIAIIAVACFATVMAYFGPHNKDGKHH
jgi:hypothetical protein